LPNTYIVGQVVLFQDVITNQQTSVLTDDATESITFFRPDGTTVTGTAIAHPSLGTYTAQYAPDQAGWWEYLFASTNGATGRGRGRFYVSPVP
jgi:hypothetical protein